jgi:hypothetical protein
MPPLAKRTIAGYAIPPRLAPFSIDRVLVMRGGQIVRTFDRKDATAEGIIAAASGATLAEVTA